MITQKLEMQNLKNKHILKEKSIRYFLVTNNISKKIKYDNPTAGNTKMAILDLNKSIYRALRG